MSEDLILPAGFEDEDIFPLTLLIGEFKLHVEKITEVGDWDQTNRRIAGVSGTAWMSFDCAGASSITIGKELTEGYHRLDYPLEVVAMANYPQTEISLADAIQYKHDIKIGETLDLELLLTRNEFSNLARFNGGVVSWMKARQKMGNIRVQFKNVTIQIIDRNKRIGRIIDGTAEYPTVNPIPTVIQLYVDGFTLIISELEFSPRGAQAEMSVRLPVGIASREDCHTAVLELGQVTITHDCQVYVDRPEENYGPWILGNTGLVIEGVGYTLDLSKTLSPVPRPQDWIGLFLHSGSGTANGYLPDIANTAYLNGNYEFIGGVVTFAGFQGHLELAAIHRYETLHPLGYGMSLEAGWLDITKTAITGGSFGPGTIEFPKTGVCHETVGTPLAARFQNLIVQSDLDLAGEVFFDNKKICWGELSTHGAEVVVWQAEGQDGYLYLPANPMASFSPDDGVSFNSYGLPNNTATALSQMELEGMPGTAIHHSQNLRIFSMDRPGGTSQPIEFEQLYAWLLIGSHGVDGELTVVSSFDHGGLGNPARPGYRGIREFGAALPQDKVMKIAQIADSAVYESNLDGYVRIPQPCNISALKFANMNLTSTANLVGGDVKLPTSGVNLDYWDLDLVPTGDPDEAGVLSVRTGQIFFTAAGIREERHFRFPFNLTWMEMLASGDLGQLFLDFNSSYQQFDHFSYAPHHLALSAWDPAITDPYLATSGTLHFNFFGLVKLNIRDTRHPDLGDPFNGRYVTVPEFGEVPGFETDLGLHGIWRDITGDALTEFDFPDQTMQYDEVRQDGFEGEGTGLVKFLQSDGLDADIEIHDGVIDICLSALTTHDLDIGIGHRFGGLSHITGCVRIVGPLIQRMSIYGCLEVSQTAGLGILAPKSGAVVEVNITTTPTSFDFSLSGDFLFSVAGSAVDISGSVHLLFDYNKDAFIGDIIGRIDCNTILMGLEGEGQVTWYMSPDTYFLQGAVKVTVCSWVGGGGFEGGLFIGHNVDKNKAWVIHAGSEKYKMTGNILPDKLTGVFGYGQFSTSVQYYIFGGGIELYAAVGAFSSFPAGSQGNGWSVVPGLLQPYVLGRCGISVHGEILGGLVSASAWAVLSLLLNPVLFELYFEGTFGLEGCVLWVFCGSVEITAGLDRDGFYLA